ncbi:tumor necrosis factor receptor superfamily member 14-like [Channa argus]|uniref:tumor necrosis factor receptor superfamily member 14-like n=1 Tax=Channa argus TaxID=215402 RepID=UPI00351F9918
MKLRTSVTLASFLILVMNIFSGHSLTCHRAEYQIGNECCPMCPAGSRVKIDCTEFRSTSCLSCLEGTYMNQPTGLKRCFICTNCDSDSGLKTKTSCTTTSDAVCEPLEGFYCVDSTEDTCVRAHRHKSCEPGQYISRKGTSSSDTECSDCTDGTFSDGTFPVCQPHTQCDLKNLQLIKAGTASTDAECGENRSNHTGTLIAGVVFLIVVIVLLGSVLFSSLQEKEEKESKHR